MAGGRQDSINTVQQPYGNSRFRGASRGIVQEPRGPQWLHGLQGSQGRQESHPFFRSQMSRRPQEQQAPQVPQWLRGVQEQMGGSGGSAILRAAQRLAQGQQGQSPFLGGMGGGFRPPVYSPAMNTNYGNLGPYNTLAQDMMRQQIGPYSFNLSRNPFQYKAALKPDTLPFQHRQGGSFMPGVGFMPFQRQSKRTKFGFRSPKQYTPYTGSQRGFGGIERLFGGGAPLFVR